MTGINGIPNGYTNINKLSKLIILNCNMYMQYVVFGVSILRNLMGYGVMVLNATFNKISVIPRRSALLVEETGVPGEYQTTKAINT